MAVVVDFPQQIKVMGEQFFARDFTTGMNLAQCIGICRGKIDSMLFDNREETTYALCLLGIKCLHTREIGWVCLKSLIARMERDS